VIVSPPHSPEQPAIPRRASDGRTGSPPPPARRADEEETDSPPNEEREETQLNTRRNSGPLQPPPTSFGIQAGTRPHSIAGAPYNPFARTLATSEAAYGLQKDTGKQDADGSGQQRQGAGRPALDVDAFKNILLTGSATPSPPTSQQTQQKPQDSSSSTDTSSVSRHSLFDQMQEAHPESPRTSFDDHPNYTYGFEDDSDDDAHNEHSSLMGPVASRPVEEGPPPPPKQKQARAFPQTVSFADFDESVSSPSTPASARMPHINNQQLQSIMRQSNSGSPSDLNKPLPPPPAESGSSLLDTDAPQGRGADISKSGDQAQAKKPPPPPVSRRQGQPSTGQPGRPRSTSNVSQSSAHNSEKGAPPPPPSRRVQPAWVTSSPAVETPPSLPTPPSESKTMPPPPPPLRRMPSKSGPKAVSNASRTGLPRNDSSGALNYSSSGQAPPAPPPRRGAQSKRSSVDGPPISLVTRRASGTDYRRTSGHSFESDRSVSLSSLQQVAEPAEDEESMQSSAPASAVMVTPERDILADMSAFQAEIEALRAQAAKDG
jgi:hypothetical protein